MAFPGNSRTDPLSFSVRLVYGSWLAATFFLLFSFDCNLRAYLMAVDFEPEVNSDMDMVKQGMCSPYTGAWEAVTPKPPKIYPSPSHDQQE